MHSCFKQLEQREGRIHWGKVGHEQDIRRSGLSFHLENDGEVGVRGGMDQQSPSLHRIRPLLRFDQRSPSRRLSSEARLKTGRPLTLYIFLLCAEGLSALHVREESLNNFCGLKINNRCPLLSHSFFFFFFEMIASFFARPTREIVKRLIRFSRSMKKRLAKQSTSPNLLLWSVGTLGSIDDRKAHG